MLGLDFPKDFKGGDSIRNNWVTNMQHFSNTFEPLEGKFDTEELLILKIDDDHYLQGYADLIRHNEDGTLSILDWKTSSLYSEEDFEHAAHQLFIYGLAKEQEGFKVRDMAWIFLKYVEVEFMGKKRANSKNDTLITKVIERRKLTSELRKYVEADLRKLGYSDVEVYLLLGEMTKNNSLDVLPDEVKSNYTVKPYIKTIPFDEEGKNLTMKFIVDTIADFERREDCEADWKPRPFTKTNKAGKVVEDTFYCNALCDFGGTCKFIKEYNLSKVPENIKDYEEWF